MKAEYGLSTFDSSRSRRHCFQRMTRKGVFYAISDVCPHDGSSLSQGSLDGKRVTCLNDGSRFDLASGSVLGGPATARVRTYHVQVRDGQIRV
jgi:nitrite reductase/ring-hydroxylating ferredoxin subunit